ncbi:MAG TPA: alpha/beta hydrolase [Caulobacteraceae bacterium]|nr:alpha/beta hydrolase [Caulobacteraceae bacterium]
MTTRAEVTDELVEMRGLRFHYRDWPARRQGAPDLVLLHGFTGHARSWDSFAQAMTDRYRVLALDQRGHGETGWAPAERYGVAEMVEDLTAFVRAMGLSHFSLLGLSMGGRVAMEYAGARPAELAALVLVDIGPEIERVGMGRIQDGLRTTDTFATKDAAFAAARAANPRPPEAHHRHRIDNNLMRLDDGRWTWRYDRFLRSPGRSRGFDAEAGWRTCAHIVVPTLVIRGGLSDILSEAVAQRMIETIPDARLETVAESGHSIPLDAPDGFLAAARRFLTG